MKEDKNLDKEEKINKLGRPRDKSRDQIIIEITLKQLTQYGYEDLSTTKIASEAQVSKATLYRRWSSKKNLVIDAFKTLDKLDAPNHGTLEKDLLDTLTQLLYIFTKTPLVPVLQILTAQMVNDKELSNELLEWISKRYLPVRTILKQAITRGELQEDLDIGIAETTIVGPLLVMVFYKTITIDKKIIKSLVDFSLKGLRG